MNFICQICEAEIDPKALYNEFHPLIDGINSGDRAGDTTPIEESIYFLKICLDCAIKYSG